VARVVAVLVVAVSAVAAVSAPAGAGTPSAYTSPALLASATATPETPFDVIVQGVRGSQSADVAKAVAAIKIEVPAASAGVRRSFSSIPGVGAQLTGRQLLALAKKPGIGAVTIDGPVAAQGYTNDQVWPQSANVTWSTALPAGAYPTVAIVDSGVKSSTKTFGSRLIKSVNLASTTPNTAGDGFGHGTFVAGIAANAEVGHAGAEPGAKIVSLDVLNDYGVGTMSDVIAAADWILQNKATYNIRVANFSLNAGQGDYFRYDPLDQAVERLWLNGVTVVAAVGNYAVGGAESGVYFAPANDPFVITVGASDNNTTAQRNDDFAAPWSASGYTNSGFFKPEISAPGRVLVGPVPSTSTMAQLHPERIVTTGYMWMSGTSFSAPVVSAAAATLLAAHPDWTPDQVKGALMLKASSPAGYSAPGQLGVGVLNTDAALNTTGTANGNAALAPFVTTDRTTGLKTFDSAAWEATVQADASWSSASWSSASWSSASWSSASWSSASWSSASWSSASWSSASWASASWASSTWLR
jgi:serine protease AprX